MVWKLSMIFLMSVLLLDDGFAAKGYERASSQMNISSTENSTFDDAFALLRSTPDNLTLNGNGSLHSDNGYLGDEVNGNLQFFQPTHELIEVKLTGNQLEFEAFPHQCNDGEEILVCYEASPDPKNEQARLGCDFNQCGFSLGVTENVLWFMFKTSVKEMAEVADPVHAVMKSSLTKLLWSDENRDISAASCNPVTTNGIVKVKVLKASPSCKVAIKNAGHKPSPTTTTVAEAVTPLSESGITSRDIWTVIGFVLLGIVIGFVIVICYCIYVKVIKKRRSEKAAAQKKLEDKDAERGDGALTTAVSKKPSTSKKELTRAKESSCKVSNLGKAGEEAKIPVVVESSTEPVTKPQSKRSKSKSSKKKKKRVPAQPPPAEAVKKPVVKKVDDPPPTPIEQPKPLPVKQASEKTARSRGGNPLSFVDMSRLHPRNSSRRYQSNSPEKEVMANLKYLLGPVDYPDADRNGLTKRKKQLPKKKKWDDREIEVLLMNVGDMFIEIQKMCDEAYTTLVDLGVQFDDDKKVVEVPKAALEALEDPNTLEFVKSFLYGAQKFQHRPTFDDVSKKMSLPDLFALAMVPRFPNHLRRHALAHLRQHMEATYYTTDHYDRQYARYPCNALYAAKAKDPERFKYNTDMKTYSREDVKRQDEEDLLMPQIGSVSHEFAPKKSTQEEDINPR